ncbi:hypothetical protein [Acinetobacter baumannii]|uniref:hypothetical protein n=1 Tax=Acinetobacter baumannii TaxID=470 RepID=UPI0012479440|nr:hypothetical protein [Acinetobacter baumannii]QEY03387.1 hypothetical protein ABCAM1_0859 [Acinetobacter baumannii]
MLRSIFSILLFICTLLLMPILLVLSFISPTTYQRIKSRLLVIEKSLGSEEPTKNDLVQITHDCENIEPKKEFVSEKLESLMYRYELDYKDRFGNITTRNIDVVAIQKELGNNRWYFVADTPEGERTFKSERVRELRDSWTGEIYKTSKSIREHLVKNYPETDNAFDD